MRHLIRPLLVSASLSLPLLSQTTINSSDKYAYSANTGWINAEADSTNGLVFAENLLSGYAYGANIGWIHFGDGTPDDLIAYGNDSSTDYGVNHDGLGNLTGQAYGANIGWITFEQTHGQPRVDLSTGQFSGYAYGANIGWISLSSLTTDSMTCPDSDNDGIADHYEQTHFGKLTTANATSNNDNDSQSDLAEYQANTDPTDSSSLLSLELTYIDPSLDEVSLDITAGPGRYLTVEHDSTLTGLTSPTPAGSKTYNPLTIAGTFSDDFVFATSAKRFFRLTTTKPLQP
ncbi:MAG: hypothetical protein AAGC74_05555 [Verrucomicrobiota bacterium]